MTRFVPPLNSGRAGAWSESGYGGGLSRAAACLSPYFDEVWVADFEFAAIPGCRPDPVCLVATEAYTGRTHRLWRDELQTLDRAPWDTGPRSVTVAYYASAEIGCFRVLGWAEPANIIDLFAEFRCETNGLPVLNNKLLGALAYFGIPAMSETRKEMMQALVGAGGPWTPQQETDILVYCGDDVTAELRLLDAMAHLLVVHPHRMGHAVIRGRFMGAAASIEDAGIPVDVPIFELLKVRWPDIQDALITEIDRGYGVFDGRTFKAERFAAWLTRTGIPWPRLDSGQLALGDDVFRNAAKTFPIVSPLRELRHSLGKLRLNSIAVGPDGRNRVMLSAFQSRTGRNQPSNSKFLFGSSTWMRGLIKPEEGMAIAYLDFASQEFAVAAALSHDASLRRAYASGDPYMQFAIDAKLAPTGATSKTHGEIRDRCKTAVLALQYGQTEYGLSINSGLSIAEARRLLRAHHEAYQVFWAWAYTNVDRGLLGATFTTPFGWQYRRGPDGEANPRSLLNWPMQAAGADMLRLACIGIVKAGINVCAPVHDALLIEAPIEDIDGAVEVAKREMIKASALVLDGAECRVDKKVVAWPDRYMDEKRGMVMWNRVMTLVGGPIYTSVASPRGAAEGKEGGFGILPPELRRTR